MDTNTRQPLESGYYYIRMIGDHDYTIIPEHMENNWTLQDGAIVIAALEQLEDSDIIVAEITKPNDPRNGFPISRWLNTGEGKPFEILQPVPSFADLGELETLSEPDYYNCDHSDPEFELLQSLCEYVNTFGGNPIEYLKDHCRVYSLELKA
ncbi:MAG: hypothetical protein BWK73_25595 [Thiothrix lacustris]|uniref:Uncharacterized protein n=1 Tax=Thiothrix lacustris TaxID=525917 RepID=A0A1Y1QL45_9GAMM|nr:MAG: hypothetical protein BWK73_25595 [Thiothrix lacustris]